MLTKEDKYWVFIHQFPGFGPAKHRKLLDHFSSMEEVYQSDKKEMQRAGIGEDLAQQFQDFKKTLPHEKLLATIEKEGMGILKITDASYPQLLSQIYDPPFLLYWKGKLDLDQDLPLAVVGSRKYSAYGEQISNALIPELAGNGMTIVSGLALGVDALAHSLALKAEGRTIAVLGSGLDEQSIYPAQNKKLMERIMDSGGTILSEFPPGTKPAKYTFPQRNRIIAGLSLGVLIVEAATKSGALITAEFASEEGREVFAVPGNIYSPTSRGTNQLIQKGAHVVTAARDILEMFNIETRSNKDNSETLSDLPPQEKKIASLLSYQPLPLEEIIKKSELDTQTVNSTLTILEIKGIIKDAGGKKYIINQ